MKTLKQNFKINYGIACSNDTLRPVFNFIYFKDGHIIACDTHLLIKCPIALHGIQNEELLEGKFIHKDTFAKIVKYHLAIPQEDGIMCYDKNGRKVALYLYADIDMKYPDVESVLTTAYSKPLTTEGALAFNLSVLSKVQKILINPEKTIQIESKSNLQTIIKPKDCDYSQQVCLIMGVTTNN